MLGYAGAAVAPARGSSRRCAVTGIDVDDGQVARRAHRRRPGRDRHGRLRRRRLVAAGRGDGRRRPAGRAAAPAGPRHRAGARAWTRDTPFTIDFSTSFYFHREGRGLLLRHVRPRRGRRASSSGASDDWLPRLGEAIERRAPALADVGIAQRLGRALRDDPRPQRARRGGRRRRRFLYATGFSGHGFLMGPAVGEVMRDLYLGRDPVVDVAVSTPAGSPTAAAGPSSTSSESTIDRRSSMTTIPLREPSSSTRSPSETARRLRRRRRRARG